MRVLCDVLERYSSGDMVRCLLVPSLGAQSDMVRVSIDGNVNFKACFCSPTVNVTEEYTSTSEKPLLG